MLKGCCLIDPVFDASSVLVTCVYPCFCCICGVFILGLFFVLSCMVLLLENHG